MKHLFFYIMFASQNIVSWILIWVSIAFVVTSCKSNQEQNKPDNKPPTFDLTKEYPARDLAFQEMAEVEYIPLETTDNSLLSSLSYLFVSDSLVVTYCWENGSVLFFDRTGKFLHSFSHKGESEQEYASMIGMTVDFDAKEVFIVDYRGFTPTKIKVYSFDGDYLRTLNMPQNFNLKITDYDKNYLFAEDISYVDYDKLSEGHQPSHNPYYLISKKTGEMLSQNVYVENRLRNQSMYTKELDEYHTQTICFTLPMCPVSKNEGEIFVADFGLDTIYAVKDKQWAPIAVKVNRLTPQNSVIMTEVCMRTDNYLLLATNDKGLMTKVPRYLLYDSASGKTETIAWFNRDGVSKEETVGRSLLPTSSCSVLPANTMYFAYSANFLVEKYGKGELSGRLKEIASQLDVEDNMVVVLVKFKK